MHCVPRNLFSNFRNVIFCGELKCEEVANLVAIHDFNLRSGMMTNAEP